VCASGQLGDQRHTPHNSGTSGKFPPFAVPAGVNRRARHSDAGEPLAKESKASSLAGPLGLIKTASAALSNSGLEVKK
jgi:hypothetical protein